MRTRFSGYAGSRPAQVGLAHVRDVEQTERLAHGLVLLDRAGGIGHRHVPAAEVDQLGAGRAMHAIQAGFLHPASLRTAPGRVKRGAALRNVIMF